MSNTGIQYLSKEKFEELSNELKHLKTDKRKEIAELLDYTKKLGDLSENAEYHEARDQQGKLEDRIAYLENLLKTAKIETVISGDVIGVGCTVEVEKEGGSKMKCKIVGSEEADLLSGKVSHLSPLGKSLLGMKRGDKVSVSTPKGMVSYKILNIE
jgi:transcription elongation factor GreA